MAAELDETPLAGELPRLCVQRLARAKAASVAAPGQFTLAADTVVAVGRRILGKARSREEAAGFLRLLSGRRHHVLTAVVLVSPDGSVGERVSDTAVVFARLAAAEIEAYLETGEWAGKAGAYAIQGQAARFVRLLSGSYSGVVGLPLHETANLLRGRGWRA